MGPDFLLYGATGVVGAAIAELAAEQNLHPILAGRNAEKLSAQAARLSLEYRSFGLGDMASLESALKEVPVVLNCAGPYVHTYEPMLHACLRTRTHYLDITGEIPVYEALSARNAEAEAGGITLFPGVAIEIAATDCLAVYLRRRLPSATRLSLGFQTEGPAALPPGTYRTYVHSIAYGAHVRRNGTVVEMTKLKLRTIDFGSGPVAAICLAWPDVFTAYYSAGIANIETYAGWPAAAIRQAQLIYPFRKLFKRGLLLDLLIRGVPAPATAEQKAQTRTHVWGEVEDDDGHKAVSRLHGPEAGVTWTSQIALRAIQRVLAGETRPGFMTPAMAYGPDFIFECGDVTREDVN